MRDGDSGHGNPVESGPAPFPLGDEGSDRDVGDAVMLTNRDAQIVPTADHTATGAERQIADDDPEDDDNPTRLAEDATGGWNHAAAAEADHEDRSDENNRAIRAEALPPAPPPRKRRRRRFEDDLPARREEPVPIDGYRELTVPEIIERVLAMPIRQAREVQKYEATHRRRKTLLVKLERYLRDKRED
jgi:hypothetical protein